MSAHVFCQLHLLLIPPSPCTSPEALVCLAVALYRICVNAVVIAFNIGERGAGSEQAEPSFIRARIRAVTCHMRTGDLAGAEQVLSSLEAALHNPDAVSEVQAKRAEFLQLKTLINEVRLSLQENTNLRAISSLLANTQQHSRRYGDMECLPNARKYHFLNIRAKIHVTVVKV